jgi:hypothetical protein
MLASLLLLVHSALALRVFIVMDSFESGQRLSWVTLCPFLLILRIELLCINLSSLLALLFFKSDRLDLDHQLPPALVDSDIITVYGHI